MAAKTLKNNPYHLQTATFKLFKKGQKTSIGEEKQKVIQEMAYQTNINYIAINLLSLIRYIVTAFIMA